MFTQIIRHILYVIPIVLFLLFFDTGELLAGKKVRLGDDLVVLDKDKIKEGQKGPVLLPGPDGKEKIGNITGDPEKGKPIYEKYCVYCHGKKGLGDGMAAIALKPSPANLSQSFIQSEFVEESVYKKREQELFDVITYGSRGSYQLYMPAWGPTLTKEERINVLAYIKQIITKGYEKK